MVMVRLWALAALASCATAALAQPRAAAPDVYVMRHLNTPAGQADPELLPEGQRAAEALATWFGSAPPIAIYVTNYRRTRATVAPLAARLHLTPIVYDPADTPGLVARVRAEHGPVLVVGHSNTVPTIVAALGGMPPAPLAHEAFGDIWLVHADGRTEARRIAP